MRDDSCEAMDNTDVREIERLRKSDGEPGAKTLWIGLQRTIDAASTIQALRMEDA